MHLNSATGTTAALFLVPGVSSPAVIAIGLTIGAKSEYCVTSATAHWATAIPGKRRTARPPQETDRHEAKSW